MTEWLQEIAENVPGIKELPYRFQAPALLIGGFVAVVLVIEAVKFFV